MIYQTIQQLINRAIEAKLIEQEDEIYARNKILSLLRLDGFVVEVSASVKKEIPELLEELIEYACTHEIIEKVWEEKENIGLIEVMGLAVLPARLKTELQEVEKFLLNIPSEIPPYHILWTEQLKTKYGNQVNEHNVQDIVRREVGQKFVQVLEYAGVFKRDEEGLAAFKRFTQTLN